MDKLTFVTSNPKKFEEASSIFGRHGIELRQEALELPELQSDSHEALVLDKAKRAYAAVGRPVLVDDTAIYFDAYENFPGCLAKFIINSIGFEGIQALLQNKDRNARFSTLVCLYDGKNAVLAKGEINGVISKECGPEVNRHIRYSSLFVPEGFDVPMISLSFEELAGISHRSRALQSLIEKMGE